jgi:hypothetical protein
LKLDRLLPGREATGLLAATLLDGAPARAAWERWVSSAGEPKIALSRDAIVARPLLPLLYASVRRNALPVERETATYLRSAFLAESLRSRAYRAIVEDLASRLLAAEVPCLFAKGAGVGALFYADPALRHAHDIEILARDAGGVRAALEGSRFRSATDGFVHDSGLPLRVHERLFVPSWKLDERVLWETSVPVGHAFRTLDAASALALALVHASRSAARESARWACDAHEIVRGGGVNWCRFADIVAASGGALPVRTQLLWLRDTFGLDIPRDVITVLEERAAIADAAERAIVAFGLSANRVPEWRRRLRSLGRWAGWNQLRRRRAG